MTCPSAVIQRDSRAAFEEVQITSNFLTRVGNDEAVRVRQANALPAHHPISHALPGTRQEGFDALTSCRFAGSSSPTRQSIQSRSTIAPPDMKVCTSRAEVNRNATTTLTAVTTATRAKERINLNRRLSRMGIF